MMTHSKSFALPRLFTGTFVFALLGAFVLYGLTGLGAPGQIAFASGTITGTVFADYDGDGVKDTSDPGIPGVVVTAYDSSGTQRGTATSTASGAYSLAATGTGPYRVEFTNTTMSYFYPGAHSTDSVNGGTSTNSGSTVQFVPDGSTSNVNLALIDPLTYSQSNPKLITTAQEAVNPSGHTSLTSDYALLSVDYSVTNPTDPAVLATVADIGSTWGLAHNRASNTVYISAFLKRHTGLGPHGIDGVYVFNASTSVLSGGFDLDGVTATNGGTIALGSVTRTNISGTLTSGTGGNNQLTSSNDVATVDLDAFAKIGKTGFGDIEMAEDYQTLWLVNLNDRTLIAVDTSLVTTLTNTDGNLAPAAAVKQYRIFSGSGASGAPLMTGAPTCTNGQLRPFGLGFYHGKGYLGVVCDASAQSTVQQPAALDAYVLSFSPSAPSAFTQEVVISMDYTREFAYQSDNSTQLSADWQRWTDTWAIPDINLFSALNFISLPQPILSGIDFTDNGSMVLGFMDRGAAQGGNNQYAATSGACCSGTLYRMLSVGDMLRVPWTGSAWGTPEAADADPGNVPDASAVTSLLSNDSSGNAGEFYYGDYFPRTTAAIHGETFEGGIVSKHGDNQVVSTAYDPTANETWAQGLIYSNADTSAMAAKRYTLFCTGSTGFNPCAGPSANLRGRFGKGSGLGDLEMLNVPAPLEIGNRAWRDDDGDGIQDAGEAGISGLTVRLFEGANLIGTTTTDANGEWYFSSASLGNFGTDGVPNTSDDTALNGLKPTSNGVTHNYQVRIESAQGSNSSLLTGYGLSPQNSAQPANGNVSATTNDPFKDVADSDATTSSSDYIISYTTGGPGVNNDGLDFGFNPWFSVGNRIWYDTDNSGTINGSEVGINGISVSLIAQGTILLNGTTYTTGQVISTQSTSGGGYYRFDNLTPGSYSVRVNASNFTSGSGTLAGYNSSGTTVNANSNTTDQRDTGVDSTTAPTNGISSNTFTLGYTTAPTGNAPTGETDGVNSPSTLNTADSRANLTVDFGFYRLTLGNTVFRDDGSGGGTFNNGIQDGTEPGISGVTVRLFRDADNDGVIDNGELVAVTTTDSNGNYLFNQQTDSNGNGNGIALVPASNYKVQVASGQSALGGFESSADSANAGTPMNTDGDDNGVGTGSANSTNVTTNAFSLGSGVSGNATTDSTGTTNNPRVDFGFVPGYSIGNRVWYDTNNGGTINGGEVGISGVTVALIAQSTVNVGGTTYTAGQTIATTTTNASGYYRFDGLPAGTYSVSLPASNWTSGGAPLAGYQGSTGQTSQNNNNPNTTSDSADNGTNPSDVTTSGISSTNIILGSTNPAPTGETDGVNSPSTATTIDARANLTVDFGLYRLTVGNTVFRDDGSGGGTANNGVQDGTEAGISGVTVQLLDGTSTVIAVTTTDANGNYTFTQQTNGAGTGNGKPIPPANNYTIRIPSGQSALVGYQSSADGANAATPMGADSDDNGTGTSNANTNNTNTSAFTLSNGGSGNPTAPAGNASTDSTGTVNNPRVDFGMVPLFSIGNRVWRDMGGGSGGVANDGLMNGTEAGISGVTLSLYQDSNSDGVADGAALQTTTTNASGYYSFSNLAAGKYIVTIDAANFGSGNPLVGYYSSSGLKTGDKADRGVDRSSAGQITAGISSQTITLGPSDNAPTGTAETDFTTGQTQSGTQNGTADGRANLQIDFGFQNSSPTSTDMGQVTTQVTDTPAVVLTWSTLSEINVIGFNVLRSAARQDGYAPVNDSPIPAISLGEMQGNEYSYTDESVEAGATYYYRIEYLRPDGSGDGTEPLRVQVPGAQCSLAVPTLIGPLDAHKVKPGKVTFRWDAVGCAVTYKLQVRAGSPKGAVVTNKKALTATEITIKKLKAGDTYAWRVLACGADGKCVASDWWTLQIRQAKSKK